ncbi:MAG: hypothetical protein MJZ11_08190 [Lachnospiraceae bacterium]|nr:hypothetical protein [Lachnospiraceae bacterium]
MKLNEINVFDDSVVLALAYEDGSNFCTEAFEKDSEWHSRIVKEYGDVEIKNIKVEELFHTTVLIFVDKEICFKVSREIMNRYMGEDNSWEEIA